MDYQTLIQQFKQANLQYIYFFTGDESFFIDKIVDAAEQYIIPESERDFNQLIVYGRDLTGKQLIEYCREYPFMGQKKLIVLKEAQELKDWDSFQHYIQKPSETTVLIVAYKNKKPDGRSVWVKLLKDKSYLYESKSLHDYQLPAFIKNLAQEHNMKIEPDAINMLVEYVGNDLSTLENELQKIKINLPPKTAVQKLHIYENTGISREYNVFELQKALGYRSSAKSIQIIQNMSLHIKNNPLIPTIAALYSYFHKIWMTKHNISKTDQALAGLLKIPFVGFIKEYKEVASKFKNNELEYIIHLLHEYDLKAKGINTAGHTDEDLFLEMGLKLSFI